MQENRSGYPSQPMPYQGPPQFIQATYPGFNRAPKPTQYNRKAAIGIGSTQMIIGVVCLVMNIILIDLNYRWRGNVSFIGYGIWGGILFIIAGLLQVLSGNKVPNKCLIIAAMVMCIIASCVSAPVLALGIVEAVVGYQDRSYYLCDYYHRCDYNYKTYWLTTVILGSIIAILALIEAVISIIGSALCCGAVCCRSSNVGAGPVYFVANQPFTNQGNNNNAFVLPIGQSPFPGQPNAPEMTYTPLIRDPGNPGLASGPPPSYAADWIPEAKSP